jgi:hypothetical protein
VGWLGRGLGDFGSQVGQGFDINLGWKERLQNMAMENARQKLADLKGPLELQELQQRIRQGGAPQFQGTVKTPGGGESAIIRDPELGTISTKDILPGLKNPEADARIAKMIQGAPTHQAKLLLTSIRERLNDPNADSAAILADAEKAYSKYLETGKPQKKEDVDLAKGVITHYDEEGNAESYPIFKGGKINPDLLQAQREMVDSAIQSNQNKFEQQKQLQADRMKAYASTYAQMRGLVNQYSVIDKTTGEPVMVNANTMNANPGRYMAGSLGQQLKNREGIFDEIKYTAGQFDTALDGMTDHDFQSLPRLQLAYVLKSRDPRSAMSEFMGSEAAATLTPAQVDYVTGLAALSESAMSLRTIAGMGQGSDTLRNAITGMLPGPATPSKSYARRQIDLFNGEVQALHRPIPPSIENMMGGAGAAPTTGTPPPGAKVRDYSQVGP